MYVMSYKVVAVVGYACADWGPHVFGPSHVQGTSCFMSAPLSHHELQ